MKFIRANTGIVATDANTGKTKWITINEGEGVNFTPDKRNGWMVTPVYVSGVVVSLESGGLLSGYDARTGERIWKVETPNCFDRMQALLADLEENQRYAGEAGKESNLIVAGGLAIVPDQHGGLLAVEPQTGAVRWVIGAEEGKPGYIGRYSSPAEWTHEGRSYVVTQDSSGVLSLIETATGKVRWRKSDLGPNLNSVRRFGDLVLVMRDFPILTRSQRRPLLDTARFACQPPILSCCGCSRT